MRSPILLILFAAALPAADSCLPITSERIVGADLARALPALQALPPAAEIGFAPAPGGRRVFTSAELARLARRFGAVIEPGLETCFVRPLLTLDRERVAAALQAAMPAARIEVVEFSRQAVPVGQLRFPLSGLRLDVANSLQLWNGVVAAPERADFPVWAKVRIKVCGKRAISVQNLRAGRPIEPAQLREESYEGPPGLPEVAEVVGWVPRRAIPAGMVVEREWLEPPLEVLRGESVALEVVSGQAHVLLAAEAQSSGRRGDVIAVRNPGSGKILHATVADRRRLILAIGDNL